MSFEDVVGLVNDPESETHRANTSDVAEVEPSKKKEGVDVEELDLSHVAFCHRGKLRTMLRKYSHMRNGSLGEIATTEHRIDLVPGSRPVSSVPYRAGPKEQKEEQDEVDRMLRAAVIEPAQSEWASPVVLVPKPDGSLRFCIDYRRVNAITVRDTYPLPRMDDCIDSLGDASVFTTLDCNSGYWQIPVAPQDRNKTTFICHAGTYLYRRMPFGLTNAPATIQRTLDIFLSSFKWKSCLVYLDDFIIFSKDMSNATVRKLTISKPTAPIRGLADVPPLREISSKINRPAVYTRFSRKRKLKPQTARTEISEGNPYGSATGGVLSPQEIRSDSLPNAEEGNSPTKSIPTPGDIYDEDAELTPEKRITHDGETEGNAENCPVVVGLDKGASQFAVPSMTYSPNASGRQLQSAPDSSTRRIPSAPFVVQRIIAHGVADNIEFLLKVRWHGFSSEEDTWEPIRHLPYNMVVRYCQTRNIALPSNMEEALV